MIDAELALADSRQERIALLERQVELMESLSAKVEAAHKANRLALTDSSSERLQYDSTCARFREAEHASEDAGGSVLPAVPVHGGDRVIPGNESFP